MKRKNIRRRLISAAVCLLLTMLTLTGCGTCSGQAVDNPKKTIVEFIDAMQSERFDRTAADAAMSCIGNYSTLGFEKYTEVNDDLLERTLFDMLRNSYSVEFTDDSLAPIPSSYQGRDMTVSGTQAFVRLRFSSLDISAMSEPLSEIVTEVGADRMLMGETYETEADAIALVEEVFTEQFVSDGDVSGYSKEHGITLEMAYIDGGWKIMVSDEFYDALLGR
ncbi:MAG: hypothetical protein E7554_02980 [Ruminococcaceae bacterium]|nr:hypothetical protein [Oscillospiraceae bacterium]